MKILVVMGTRPEVIKLAPVVMSLRQRKGLKTLVCATAQHRELQDQMLKTFGVKPDFDLDLMRKGQSPDAVAQRVQASLDPILARVKPDLVVVQGDTTTAMAAALCAHKRKIPIAHVEAGLRSHDLENPFPEEGNRILIDHFATLHFPPTRKAKGNLAQEGITGPGVIVTGNTVVDALHWAAKKIKTPPASAITREVLVTFHRRESFGAPLKGIFQALLTLVRRHEDLVLIYPVHPNPKVRLAAKRWLRHPRIRLIKPLPYLEFLCLMKRVHFLITDSGGLQEESVCLHKPVLVARNVTERPEIIAAGAGKLVGLRQKNLIAWATKLLTNKALHRRMSGAKNPYGDGKASERIASSIARSKLNSRLAKSCRD